MAYLRHMRYWWANQKVAYDAEVAGGYLWSRKRRADGSRNPFYESVRLTQPGDVIFGYQGPAIRAVGFVLGPATDAPCPTTGVPPLPDEAEEAPTGWLIPVTWLELHRPLFPAQYMPILEPLLPEFSAPLTPQGRGIQGGRLMEVPSRLATALLQLAGGRNPAQLLNPSWEPHQLRFVFSESQSPLPAETPPSNPSTEEHS